MDDHNFPNINTNEPIDYSQPQITPPVSKHVIEQTSDPNNVSDPPIVESTSAKKSSAFVPAIIIACVFTCVLCFVIGTHYGNGLFEQNAGKPNGIVDSTSSGSEQKAPRTSSSTASDDINAYKFETHTSSELLSIAGIAAKTMDTVVEVIGDTGSGSGVIVDSNGFIVTNNHVVENQSTIKVRLRDGTSYNAVLKGTDEESDIAIIKIDAADLPVATLGDSSTLVVGELVVAIGNPLGKLGGTVTNGIISALERQISIGGQTMTLLQTNAAISPGNSGGGLFNSSGELIGIVNAKSVDETVEGIAFAIPINTAIPVMEDIIRYGYVRGRVKAGITLLDIYSDSYVRYYNVPSQGTYISSVEIESDAEKAGLLVGDMIKTINGVEVKSASQVTELIKESHIGDTLTFNIVRVVSYSGIWQIRYETEELTIDLKLTEYKNSSSLITN